jgi:hypothetical protein
MGCMPRLRQLGRPRALCPLPSFSGCSGEADFGLSSTVSFFFFADGGAASGFFWAPSGGGGGESCTQAQRLVKVRHTSRLQTTPGMAAT